MQLVAILRRASLFVGGDTGPLQIALALNVPVTAIFGPTNPERNGPFRSGDSNYVIKRDDLDCLNCHKRQCRFNNMTPPECMKINPEIVFDNAISQLRNRKNH